MAPAEGGGGGGAPAGGGGGRGGDPGGGGTGAGAGNPAAKPPIAGYDEMNVEEITGQLDGLSEAQLRRVRNYEQGNKNRQTLIAEIDRRLEATP